MVVALVGVDKHKVHRPARPAQLRGKLQGVADVQRYVASALAGGKSGRKLIGIVAVDFHGIQRAALRHGGSHGERRISGEGA